MTTKITNANLTTRTIEADKVKSNILTADELANNAVTSNEITDGAIVNADISPSAAIASSKVCLLYTSPSPRDRQKSRMPSSA